MSGMRLSAGSGTKDLHGVIQQEENEKENENIEDGSKDEEGNENGID